MEGDPKCMAQKIVFKVVTSMLISYSDILHFPWSFSHFSPSTFNGDGHYDDDNENKEDGYNEVTCIKCLFCTTECSKCFTCVNLFYFLAQ